MQRDGVPINKAHRMLDSAKTILGSASHYNLLPEDLIRSIPDFRAVDPFYFIQSRPFSILTDGSKLIESFDKELYEKFSYIKIVDANEFSTEVLGDNSVIIKARLNSNNLLTLSNFIHELGHAKQLLTTPKEVYTKLTKFHREKYAYNYQLMILSMYLEPQELDVIKWKMLSKVADAWFEFHVHTDPSNIHKVFLRSRSQLYSTNYQVHSIEYLLNFNYQKYAGESVTRGLIAHELLQ